MNQKLFVLIENCFQSSLCAFAKPEPVISRLRDQFRDSLIFQDLPLSQVWPQHYYDRDFNQRKIRV